MEIVVWTLAKYAALLGGFAAILALCDCFAGALIRAFPAIGEWLDDLAMRR